jgi:hypothetical protein
MAISTAFIDTARVYGAESVEMEWRLPVVHRSLATGMARVLDSCPEFTALETVATRDEYSDGDCRRITPKDGEAQYLYKRRVVREPRGPATTTVSLERYGDPPEEKTPFPTYREKTRRRWAWRCWEVHVTEFYTNDARYKDSDGVLYDIELEFQPTRDETYIYPIDTIVSWGDTLIQELQQEALRSLSLQKA